MRILHVIPAVARQYGGPSVVVMSVAKALEAAGHDVVVATTDADGAGRLDVKLGEVVAWSGVATVFFRRTASEAFKWSPSLARWLRGHVRDFDVVDVHAVFSHSSIAAGRACRRSGVPYVVRPHGALDPWSLGRKALQKQMVLAAGGRRMLKAAALVQYTTTAEQQLAERELPWLPSGVVVPLGVDEACFTQRVAPPSNAPYVLVMSRLEEKKGLELLIDAFHDVASSPPLDTWRLVVAGDGRAEYVQALRARAAAGRAAARIEFTGWVNGERKHALVGGAALFASPSEQENFGLSLAEAMAGGVPVFVSPGVNLADVVAEASAGWVVPRRPDVFRGELRSALADAGDLRARGARARGAADRFRWDRSAEILAGVYRRAAGGTESPAGG